MHTGKKWEQLSQRLQEKPRRLFPFSTWLHVIIMLLMTGSCIEKSSGALKKRSVTPAPQKESPTSSASVASQSEPTILRPLADNKRLCVIKTSGAKKTAKIVDKGLANRIFLNTHDTTVTTVMAVGGTVALVVSAAQLLEIGYKSFELSQDWRLAQTLADISKPFDTIEGTSLFLKEKGIDIDNLPNARKLQIQKILRSSSIMGTTGILEQIKNVPKAQSSSIEEINKFVKRVLGIDSKAADDFDWAGWNYNEKQKIEDVAKQLAENSHKALDGKKFAGDTPLSLRGAFASSGTIDDALKQLKADEQTTLTKGKTKSGRDFEYPQKTSAGPLNANKRGLKPLTVKNGVILLTAIGGGILLKLSFDRERKLQEELTSLTSGTPPSELSVDYNNFLAALESLPFKPDNANECGN